MNLRKVLMIALAVAVVALGGLVVMAALRDTEPPKIYVEHEVRVPVGQPINVFVSTDEPATITLYYNGLLDTRVTMEHIFEERAIPGEQTALVVATDAAGNAAEQSLVIVGVPEVEAVLEVETSVTAGDPLGARLTLVGAAATAAEVAEVVDVSISLDGRPLPLRVADGLLMARAGEELSAPGGLGGGSSEAADGTASGEGLAVSAASSEDQRLDLQYLAVAASTMTVDPTAQTVEVSVVDEFGRVVQLSREVTLTPLPVEVEQLQLSAATLSVITPEGREREAAAVDQAWARAQEEAMWNEPFLMPIGGVNTSGFGDARRYAQGGPVSFHYGLDLAAPSGTPILATNSGRVLIADHYPIKGGWVAIDHGAGVMSYYFHMIRIYVQDGQMVQRGEVIGEVGSEGLSTGPHLHWEMRVHGEASNPLAWAGRVFPGHAR